MYTLRGLWPLCLAAGEICAAQYFTTDLKLWPFVSGCWLFHLNDWYSNSKPVFPWWYKECSLNSLISVLHIKSCLSFLCGRREASSSWLVVCVAVGMVHVDPIWLWLCNFWAEMCPFQPPYCALCFRMNEWLLFNLFQPRSQKEKYVSVHLLSIHEMLLLQ